MFENRNSSLKFQGDEEIGRTRLEDKESFLFSFYFSLSIGIHTRVSYRVERIEVKGERKISMIFLFRKRAFVAGEVSEVGVYERIGGLGVVARCRNARSTCTGNIEHFLRGRVSIMPRFIGRCLAGGPDSSVSVPAESALHNVN